MEIAAALEEQVSIPVVAAQMALIQEVQTDTWWQDVTVSLLEIVRKRLRGLVHLIEKRSREPIYTDFEDEIGERHRDRTSTGSPRRTPSTSSAPRPGTSCASTRTTWPSTSCAPTAS